MVPIATSTEGRHLRMRAYIGLLVLIPILGSVVMAAVAAQPRFGEWQRSKEIEQRVKRIAGLLRISNGLGGEEYPTQLLITSKRLRIPPGILKFAIGIDPSTSLEDHRKHTDDVLREYPNEPLVPKIRKSLNELRVVVDTNKLDDILIHNRFDQLHAMLRDQWVLEARSPAILRVSGISRFRRDLDALEQSLNISASISRQHERLFEFLNDKPDLYYLRSQLAIDRSSEEVASKKLMTLVRPNRLLRLRNFRAQFDNSTIIRETTALIGGDTVSVSDVGRIAAIVKDGLQRNEKFDDVVYTLIDDSLSSAAALNRAAKQALLVMMGTALALLIFTTVAATVVARMFSQPLRKLALRARIVAEGDLDVAPGRITGPREIAVVSSVVNDLVANLRRVQAQASALSKGEIDNAILADTIPGALGQTMKASVDRLSRSIREREELQDQLTRQATHDALTGLANRAAVLMALDQSFARSRRSGEAMAVLFIDLDDFKRTNDDHDHSVGDQVLIASARRISSAVRAGDIVARLGGDEFCVVVDAAGSTQDVRELSERIIESLSAPIELSGITLRIGASIGFAFLDTELEGGRDLLRRADLAMYRAKELGRGRVIEFDAALHSELEERQELQQAMIGALSDENLRIHVQPIYGTVDGQIRSVEALLRWDRPGFGLQSPSRFIPILESSPLIVDIGRWVLCEATKQAVILRASDSALADISVAVNLSGRHLLAPSVLQDVERALVESGLPPSALTIEITETALVTDMATAIENLKAMRALGVKIAIDDFGTGYTSVGQLSRLPIDILKIDRSFIDQIDVKTSQRIVEMIIELGHTLGLEVVGEGIEDQHQRDVLGRLGCDRIQGFLLGRPVKSEDLLLHVLSAREVMV